MTGVDGQRSGKLDKRGKSVHVIHVVYILVLIHGCVRVCVLVCVAPPVRGRWRERYGSLLLGHCQ